MENRNPNGVILEAENVGGFEVVRDANSDEDEIVRVGNSDEEHEDNPVVFDGFVDVDVPVVNISLGQKNEKEEGKGKEKIMDTKFGTP